MTQPAVGQGPRVRKMSDKPCEEWQENRRVPDFTCNLRAGHGDAHTDPRTGTRWRGRGMRPIRGGKKE